jgi:hypothetical protein
MFILNLAGTAAFGTAGYILDGSWGVLTGLLAWLVLRIACWRMGAGAGNVLPWRGRLLSVSAYHGIDEVIDELDAIASERGWDLDKRLDIARMVCENRGMGVDELEQRYDRGERSALYTARHDALQ